MVANPRPAPGMDALEAATTPSTLKAERGSTECSLSLCSPLCPLIDWLRCEGEGPSRQVRTRVQY